MLVITSPANPRVKHLVSLRKRSVRDSAGVTMVDGYDELCLALEAGVRPTTVYCCPAMIGDTDRLTLRDRLADMGVELVELGTSAFAKVSYRESPDGWLAIVPRPGRVLDELALLERPLVLVAEAVEKPGNLGAMLRTADAAGVDAVVTASPATDWANPNVIRASKGAVFTVPVASATTGELVPWLRERHLSIVVATPDARTTITEADLTGPLAVVVGAEHDGVSRTWLDAADVAVTIPMHGSVNSLNVATSAAIVLYEAVRQRGRPQ